MFRESAVKIPAITLRTLMVTVYTICNPLKVYVGAMFKCFTG